MAIQVEWYGSNQAAIRYVIDRTWTWDDFYQAITLSHRMMDESAATSIILIIDMTQSNLLPQNVLSHVRNVSQRSHPKTGTGIVVGAGVFVQSLFRVIQRLTPERMKRMHMVKTLVEADAIIVAQQSAGRQG